MSYFSMMPSSYYASEFLRQPKYQKKIANKAKQLSYKGLDYAIDALSKHLLNKASNKPRPEDIKSGGNINEWYPMEIYSPEGVKDPTSPLYQKGSGLSVPFPFVDWKKAWQVVSDPRLFKGPEVSAKEGKELIAEYKRQYQKYKDSGDSRSYNSWIKWKGYGKGLDIQGNFWVLSCLGIGTQDLEILLRNN